MSPLAKLRPECAADAETIDRIVLDAFGPGVFTRAAFRVREMAPHDPNLSFVAEVDDLIVGSVRLTPINVGETSNGLLLGPLVVDPQHKNCGHGRALVRHSLDQAQRAGAGFVLLVGDLPYYNPLGFDRFEGTEVSLPGPVDPKRLLIAELQPDAGRNLSGPVRGCRRPSSLGTQLEQAVTGVDMREEAHGTLAENH